MTDDFSGGYFKALLDIYGILNEINLTSLNSKKKYERFVHSFLSLLLTNGDARTDIIRYGSNVDYWETKLIIKQDGTVTYDETRNS